MNRRLLWSIATVTLILLSSSCGSTKQTTTQSQKVPVAKTNNPYNNYVERYANIALYNQRQYGIPASITLAQGLLESGAGRSTLATQANNHFGIKCHRSWRGSRTFHDDDRPNECFRSYDNAEDSFKDHGQFLQQPRYQALFRLDPTDYKGWARGLQQAGYATDRGYANKLIKIIEDYRLYLIDAGNPGRHYTYDKPTTQPERKIPTSKSTTSADLRQVYISSGLHYVLAGDGDSLSGIAKELGISERSLTKYNDLPEGYPLEKGDVVYLERKLKRALPPHYEHVIKVGESIHSIAQTYGIQLNSLYKLNNLAEDYFPMEGDILKLR